jgi:hypothetical protein
MSIGSGISLESQIELEAQANRFDRMAERVRSAELAESFRRLAADCRARLATLEQQHGPDTDGGAPMRQTVPTDLDQTERARR